MHKKWGFVRREVFADVGPGICRGNAETRSGSNGRFGGRTRQILSPLGRSLRLAHDQGGELGKAHRLLLAIVFANALIAISGIATSGASPGDFPNHSIQLIVPGAPGSSADIGARTIATKVGEILGQQILVEARPGAGGIVGAQAVAKAAPNGYTLEYGTAQTQAADVSVYPHLPYDPMKDFTPIAKVASDHVVLAVSSTLPVSSVQDLIAYAKARVGQLNYASTGNGTTAHLTGALFDSVAGVNIRHVPYNSSAQMITDLVGGAVQMVFYPYNALQPMITAGKLKVLATTGEHREPTLPNVPTMIEAGVPGFTSSGWHAFFGPAGLPKPVVDRLYTAISQALHDPTVDKQMIANGDIPDLAGPDELAKFEGAEIERYRKLVDLAGAKVE